MSNLNITMRSEVKPLPHSPFIPPQPLLYPVDSLTLCLVLIISTFCLFFCPKTWAAMTRPAGCEEPPPEMKVLLAWNPFKMILLFTPRLRATGLVNVWRFDIFRRTRNSGVGLGWSRRPVVLQGSYLIISAFLAASSRMQTQCGSERLSSINFPLHQTKHSGLEPPWSST